MSKKNNLIFEIVISDLENRFSFIIFINSHLRININKI